VTEAEARTVLHARSGIAVFERWMADQPWRKVTGDWLVSGELQGWRFRLAEISGGLQVSATARGSSRPAVWLMKE
jgi:hypothetical protein